MPAQDRSGEARQIAETLFQAPVRLQRLTGGLVHFVYLATTHDGRGRVIVKIRGDHYAELPAISCEPAAIQREATALRLLASVPALQGLVPRLLYADSVRGHLAMTEVAPGGCSLAEILEDSQRIPPGMAGLTGSLLGLCHTATADLSPDPEDEPFFEREPLRHRRSQKYPACADLLDSL
jgi:hypothetical protein